MNERRMRSSPRWEEIVRCDGLEFISAIFERWRLPTVAPSLRLLLSDPRPFLMRNDTTSGESGSPRVIALSCSRAKPS